MSDDMVLVDIHDWGDAPCGKPAYERVARDYGWAYFFEGHRTLDGSTPNLNDPLLCGSCGQDTGLLFAPTRSAGH